MNVVHSSSAIGILDNACLAWGLLACGLAQFSKLIIELIVNRKWRPSVLIETGGMPSSHSALVTGTTAGVGLELGFDHPAFALGSAIAFIVMYDASGIRREAGKIAEKVNLLKAENNNEFNQVTLKENLGHTRLEVLVGSLIGPAISLPGIAFIGSPLDFAKSFGLSIG